MNTEIMQKFYEMWTDSDEYQSQSALENDKYDMYTKEIEDVIGAKTCHDIGDSIMNLACDAEYAGFVQGLRYGIMFISNTMKGKGLMV